MLRLGIAVLCMALLSCGNDKKTDEEESGFSYAGFSGRFKKITPPYALSDTGLLKNKDTASIRNLQFAAYLPDSLKRLLFGKTGKPKFIPLVHLAVNDETSLYLVKAQSGNKKVALAYAFDDENFSAVFPFLVPDTDPTTSQISAIDRAFAITRTVTQRRQNAITGEGKEVYDYDAGLKKFTLILTNPLHPSSEVINPIDTFSRKHKWAGDYVKNKKNFVSIRDGRSNNQLTVFIHIDKNEGGCTGELKGDLLISSPTTAIYREGGDPCVMTFRFSSSSVTLEEQEGCGSHRGIDCIFDGSYPRKKIAKAKSAGKKKSS